MHLGNILHPRPDIPQTQTLEITGNAVEWTTENVILTAFADEGTIEYFNGSEWIQTSSVTATENGIYTFRVADSLGNVTEKSVVVDKIDRTAPVLEITGNLEEWTNGRVILSATSDEGVIEYRVGSIWLQADSATALRNGTYTFRATDAAGNVTEKSVTVSCIDKDAPVLEISASTDAPAREVTLSASASDNASGIAGIQYSFDNSQWFSGSSITVSQNGTVYFKTTDNAGNVSISSKTVENIAVADDVFVRNNLLDNGHSQILAWDKNNGTVGYVAIDGSVPSTWRGVWDWDGSDAELWRVAGIGHFKGSEVDYDGILLYNGIGNTFAAWTDIHDPSYGYVSLCHVDGSFETKGIGNFDNNDYDDILIFDANGSVGLVLDGTDYKSVWHVSDPENNVWELSGIADFGGETDSLIFRNSVDGHFYRWDNQDSSFTTWDWACTDLGDPGSSWELVATGDFEGDGIDDLMMMDSRTRNVWIWDDGNINSSRWRGTLNKNFSIEAVGDYNGDGCEDLLLREQVSGWGGLGFWGNGYAGNWVDLNTRVETNYQSSFTITA